MGINYRIKNGLALCAVMTVFVIVAAACSSSTPAPVSNEPVLEPTATSLPTAIPTATPVPTPTPVPTSTPVPPAPTNTPVPALPTSTPSPTPTPTSTPTPEPTPTPIPYVYDAYGFIVELDPGSNFASVNLASTGYTASEADLVQGVLTFTYKGASVLLYWLPADQQTPSGIVSSTYQSVTSNQPNVTFLPINEGEISVNGETGWYGGFVATDSTGASAGGGLMGSWVCPASKTIFSLTATGPDATALQLRFDRLLSGFLCS